MTTAEIQLSQSSNIPGATPREPMKDIDEREPFREPRHKIPWGTVAAIAAVISTCGGALIALGRTMFASKDEYTELRVHVRENDKKFDHAIERLEKGTERLNNTIERLDRNVTILNTRMGMTEESPPGIRRGR
jgi:hypothetical protein